ncbi:MAG: hypothetical protein ACI8ZN_001598 [Bacteroidia bacterium]|jgi:hypothetical protein
MKPNFRQLNLRKVLIITFMVVFFQSNVRAQSIQSSMLTIQIDSTSGYDAMVWWSDNLGYNDLNYGDDERILVHAWTNSGEPDLSRSLLYFDLTKLPSNAIVDSVYLSIYNNPTTASFKGEHQYESGNKCRIGRITSIWKEDEVTWNDQPTYDYGNEVSRGTSIYKNEDYTDMNVTVLTKEMLAKPSNSFGYVVSLETEEKYRALVFASSEFTDSTRWPKLGVYYHVSSSSVRLIERPEMVLFPNPSSTVLTLQLPQNISQEGSVEVYDALGQLVLKKECSDELTINISALTAGSYSLLFTAKDHQWHGRFVRME